MKKTLGYLALVLSFVAWGGVVLLPFLELTAGQIAGATTALVVAGEVLFLVSIALLGKEVWGRIKAVFKRSK